MYIGEHFGTVVFVFLPLALPHGHEAVDRTTRRLGQPSATLCTASIQCTLPHHFASCLVLMLVGKGHNVFMPWPGHDFFYPQPMTQGESHINNVALLLL